MVETGVDFSILLWLRVGFRFGSMVVAPVEAAADNRFEDHVIGPCRDADAEPEVNLPFW